MASIDLRNVSRCQIAEKGIIFLFCAAFRSGVYPLKASSEAEAIEWANVINERIVDSEDGTDTDYTYKDVSSPLSEDRSDAEEFSTVDSPDTHKRRVWMLLVRQIPQITIKTSRPYIILTLV